MSEEIQNEIVDTQVQEPQAPEISPVEQKAIDLGWRPKEQFNGEEHEFIDAAEFVRRQPLFDKIEYMGRELKETKKVLNMLQDHHKKVKESEYKRALDELRVEKKRALEEGDADKLLAVDDALAEVRTAQLQSQQPQPQPQVDPRFNQWVSQNKWYETDSELREFADAIGLTHAKNNPHKSPEEILDYVVAKVKQSHKDKFENPKRNQPSAVEGNASLAGKQKKSDDFAMSEEEIKVMNTFVRSKLMTKEEYVAELKKVRG